MPYFTYVFSSFPLPPQSEEPSGYPGGTSAVIQTTFRDSGVQYISNSLTAWNMIDDTYQYMNSVGGVEFGRGGVVAPGTRK